MPTNGLPAIGPPWSELTAYDLNEGTIKWQVPLGVVKSLEAKGIRNTGSYHPTRNGLVVTAGGLIFIGTWSDRTLRAYDKDTGKVLWEKEIDANPEGIPAVYEVARPPVHRLLRARRPRLRQHRRGLHRVVAGQARGRRLLRLRASQIPMTRRTLLQSAAGAVLWNPYANAAEPWLAEYLPRASHRRALRPTARALRELRLPKRAAAHPASPPASRW